MVYFVTGNRNFGQRIRFELTFAGVSFEILSLHDSLDGKNPKESDTLVLDLSSGVSLESYERWFPRFFQVILLSDYEKSVSGCKTLLLPLALGALASAVADGKPLLSFYATDGAFSVLFFGERVSLSKTEYLLLKTLADADGAFVDRKTLLSAAFEPEASESALNVYMHYLREKLEKGERRLFFASRGQGYALRLPGKEEKPC